MPTKDHKERADGGMYVRLPESTPHERWLINLVPVEERKELLLKRGKEILSQRVKETEDAEAKPS